MCGIAGAGKTTYAKELERRGYVRLSIDEEIWERFGRYGVDYEPDEYADHSVAAEAALRERLVDLIDRGRDVVVDFSFWQRAARDRYKRLVEQAGASWDVVYLKVDPAILSERLAARSARFDANAAFPVTDEILRAFVSGFEEPGGEGETVIET